MIDMKKNENEKTIIKFSENNVILRHDSFVEQVTELDSISSQVYMPGRPKKNRHGDPAHEKKKKKKKKLRCCPVPPIFRMLPRATRDIRDKEA